MFARFFVSLGRASFYIGSFLIGLVFVSLLIFSFFSPVTNDPNAKAVKFQVEEGDDLKKISQKMEEDGLIKHWWALYYLARLKGSEFEEKLKKIVVGEYTIAPNMSINKILSALIKGDVFYYQFTIPEGATLAEIIKIVGNSGVISTDKLAVVLNNRDFIYKMGIRYRTFEGFLFPETYRFSKPITAEKIIEKMVLEGRSRLTQQMKDRFASMGLSLEQIITLASIIEKETAQHEERALIASVFHNRLRLGMPLQSDPTVIYGLSQFNGNLTKEQLKTPSPYNTYLNKGLPPTAICNPGIESIRAAISPAETEYLYFVAKNDGSHIFSKTYKEHLEAVDRYQRGKVVEVVEEKIDNKAQLEALLNQKPLPTPTPTPTPTPKPKKTGISFLDPMLKEEENKNQGDLQKDLLRKILGADRR